jgi:hypothetical protein
VLAGLPLLTGCYGLDAEIAVRILTTASTPPLPWVQVTGNVQPPPSNCTVPHDACRYKIDPEDFEELVLEAVGSGFQGWACSNPTSIPPIRRFSERIFSGVAGGEQCAAIFCTTHEVNLEVDVGLAGVNANVKIEQSPNRAFLVRNGRVSIESLLCSAADSTCFARVCQGATIALVAKEETLRFVGFEGQCGAAVAGDRLRSRLVVDGDKSCTAAFAPLELEVGVTGNGRVVSTSGGIDCSALGEATCVRPFPLNRRVHLLAQPDPGARFIAWGGDCQAGAETVEVVMEGDRQCTAEFDALAVAPGEPGVVERVSIAPDGGDIPTLVIGGVVNGIERQSGLSADGGSFVFPRAPEIDPGSGEPIPGLGDGILVRDLQANQTEHLVLTSEFTAEGKQLSVSADGRMVAFVSGSSLVTHNLPDDRTQAAFVYDRERQELVRASVDDPAHAVELIHSGFDPAVMWTEVSANGRYVVFAAARRSDFVQRIYVRDTCAGAAAPCAPSTRNVSVNSAGVVPNQGWTAHPSISADGRLVAFISNANLLTPGGPDEPGPMKVFVHDRDADGNGVFDEAGGIATTPISVPGLGFVHPRISDSGRFLAYGYSDFALAATYGGSSTSGQGVLVYDTVEGTTRGLFGDATVDSAIGDVDFSGDGRFIAFATESSQIAVQDTCFGAPDGCAPATQLVSVNGAGDPADGFLAVDAQISGDGRIVSFGSIAANLVPDDVEFDPDFFVAASGFVRTLGGRPAIDELPANLQAGSPEQLLPLEGSGFVPGVRVFWGGEPRPTIYISETRLEFRVNAADLALPARVSVVVRNPGGKEAGPVRLEILE